MPDKMEQASNVFLRFTNLMDQNIRGVQIGCYSIAFIGLAVAVRKVRPFARFKKPSDIPNHFFEERKVLTGLVKRIEPTGGLLMIQHKPLIEFPGVNPGKQLPVKISGVNVSGLGISWLQSIVVGNEVQFVPILKEKNLVQCEILLPQVTAKNKQRLVNVGESLVRIGFGELVSIEKPLTEDPNYLPYYNRLQIAEAYALRKRLGYKYYIKPTKKALLFTNSMLQHAYKQLGHLLALSSKQISKVPKFTAL